MRRYTIAAVVVQVLLLHCKYVLATGTDQLRPPVGLTAWLSQVQFGDEVMISWKGVPGAMGYQVFYTPLETMHMDQERRLNVVDMHAVLTSPQNNTELLIQVATIGSGGRVGKRSSALRVPTTMFPQFFPARGVESTAMELQATAVHQTSITILWKPPLQSSGVQGYRLLIFEEGQGVQGSGVAAHDRLGYAFTHLLPGTTYYILLHAVYNDGMGSTSQIAVTTLSASLPSALMAAPQKFRITVVDHTLVSFSWDLVSNATLYTILLSSDEGLVTFVNTSASSFTTKLSSYQRDRTTIFFVFAVNNAGMSPLSLFRSIPLRDMSIPSKPTDLQVLYISESFASLFWRHPLGEVRISTYSCTAIKLQKRGNNVSVAETNTTATVCTLGGLQPGAEYLLAVRAINSVSRSAAAELTIVMPGGGDEESPAPMLIASVTEERNIQFSWNRIDKAVEYILYSILDNVRVPLTRTTMLQYTLVNVPAGISLLYQVAAISRNGREGTLSAPVAVNVPSLLLPAPTNLQSVRISGGINYVITWDPVPGTSVYSVREEYEDGSVRILQTAVASIAVEDLRPNITVTYQVAAVDPSGREGAGSAVLMLQTPLGEDDLTILLLAVRG